MNENTLFHFKIANKNKFIVAGEQSSAPTVNVME